MAMKNDPTLANLIEYARKGGEVSYERLSQACGGFPTAKRLHQMQNQHIKSFPDPETIKSLSRGTGFSVGEIVSACARSLGLVVDSDDSDLIRIHGISDAPVRVVELIRQLGREVAAMSVAQRQDFDDQSTYRLAAREPDQQIGPDQMPEDT